jgi:hypothetical protein
MMLSLESLYMSYIGKCMYITEALRLLLIYHINDVIKLNTMEMQDVSLSDTARKIFW